MTTASELSDLRMRYTKLQLDYSTVLTQNENFQRQDKKNKELINRLKEEIGCLNQALKLSRKDLATARTHERKTAARVDRTVVAAELLIEENESYTASKVIQQAQVNEALAEEVHTLNLSNAALQKTVQELEGNIHVYRTLLGRSSDADLLHTLTRENMALKNDLEDANFKYTETLKKLQRARASPSSPSKPSTTFMTQAVGEGSTATSGSGEDGSSSLKENTRTSPPRSPLSTKNSSHLEQENRMLRVALSNFGPDFRHEVKQLVQAKCAAEKRAAELESALRLFSTSYGVNISSILGGNYR